MSRPILRIAAFAPLAAAALLLGACSSGTGSAAPSESAAADEGWVTDGKFTVATGEPAYYPWVIDDAPESGEGFESAVAYAVAAELGFAEEDVVWVRTTFDEAIAPGPKDFDVNLQQFSITDERKESVDFSSPYYETTQVVITTGSSPAADATSLADLKDLLIGAQVGTTSFTAIEQAIAPTQGAQAFNSNDDAKLALENGQVDAIVTDLPTAFYISGVELTDGKLVGQLPAIEGQDADAFGLVLAKDSPLTDQVTAAVDALREDGTLDDLATEWLGGEGQAPLLQ
ncbi:ABC transporter substrate-binding protein [Microbacterium terricola]|uniref:Amino acid ABC transporter substrate-binding protein n=1 Tax=Microbacterium terricola TaxID=344163 RepID=A0ABM8DWB1_9MICO|nr:ABC transporter substrate-binding protein [Microbacterium terricola]UYK39329.1 ABC transporter substrate-binding protein [Microbacterium terricola]BDV29948.1 amino acid ABC transporter substrate-binding protein [Microbacterium terricola]